MPRINIKTGTIILGTVICIGFLAVILADQSAFWRLRVGRAVYNHLLRDEVLEADTLPPRNISSRLSGSHFGG
jgi:hypothetical protein